MGFRQPTLLPPQTEGRLGAPYSRTRGRIEREEGRANREELEQTFGAPVRSSSERAPSNTTRRKWVRRGLGGAAVLAAAIALKGPAEHAVDNIISVQDQQTQQDQAATRALLVKPTEQQLQAEGIVLPPQSKK